MGKNDFTNVLIATPAHERLEDVFSQEIVSRYEAVTQVDREKRIKETDAMEEFDKLLAKPEIRDIFIRLKDK